MSETQKNTNRKYFSKAYVARRHRTFVSKSVSRSSNAFFHLMRVIGIDSNFQGLEKIPVLDVVLKGDTAKKQ